MESQAGRLMRAWCAAMAFALLVVNETAGTARAEPICVPTPILDAREYRNIDYQFSVKIPLGLHACKTSSPCPNHGIWLPLKDDGCKNIPNVPYIDVDAEYNAGSEVDTPDHEPARTPAQLATIQCPWRDANVAWLKEERLGSRNAAGCRREFPDGHIEVSIIALRRTEPWAARWIEISADLSTTPERYEADMRIFRTVLKGVWIHSDGPLD
jgi:hypothetical protein